MSSRCPEVLLHGLSTRPHVPVVGIQYPMGPARGWNFSTALPAGGHACHSPTGWRGRETGAAVPSTVVFRRNRRLLGLPLTTWRNCPLSPSTWRYFLERIHYPACRALNRWKVRALQVLSVRR